MNDPWDPIVKSVLVFALFYFLWQIIRVYP
jgi:hypothetical protein